MRDIKDVETTDCANQRLLTPDGADRMHDLGLLLAANGIAHRPPYRHLGMVS